MALAPLLVAIVVAAAMAPVTQRLARRCGVVNRPTEDRWSKNVIPLLGGVALMAGFFAGALPFLPDVDTRCQAVLAGAALMFGVGLWDDIKGVRPTAKLAAQLAAAAILILGGVEVELAGRRIIGIPLTMLWVVGITNALNLLDNMDGLASGVAAIAALILAAFGASTGVPWLTAFALAIAGAALGFLPWNVSPAKQFLGDAGALPLGFLLAAAGILGTYRDAGNILLVMVAPVFVLGVPILDTTLVTLVRKFHGRKVSQGGKDHLSHRLVALGMSERRAVALLWTVTAGFGLVALLASPTTSADLNVGSFLVFGLVAAGAAIFGVVLGEVKVYRAVEDSTDAGVVRARQIRETFLRYFRALAVILLDLGFVGVAFTAAHLLYFGGRGQPFDQYRFFEALPVLIVCKFVALQVFGLQKGLWRYFGLRDLAAVSKAVVSGTLLTAVGLALAYGSIAPFSKFVLLLDAILLFLFIVGSRALFRMVVEQMAGFPDDGIPVLLVGAGVEGDLALRSLRLRGDARPVGILSEDPTLQGRRFHGIKILSGIDGLEKALSSNPEVQEVIFARAPDPHRLEDVRRIVHAAGAHLILAPSAHRFTEI